jgi:hypothetical protein
MKQLFKISVIALVMVCCFPQIAEAKVKKTRKAKAKTSKTITTQNVQEDNDNWLIGTWEVRFDGGAWMRVNIKKNNEIFLEIMLPSWEYPTYISSTYVISGDDIYATDTETGSKSHYNIDRQGKRLLGDDGTPFKKVKK